MNIESIYEFMLTQQRYGKKRFLNLIWELVLTIVCLFVSDYLSAINSVNDNKYDMLTHKNLKFLFYRFSNILDRTFNLAQKVKKYGKYEAEIYIISLKLSFL